MCDKRRLLEKILEFTTGTSCAEASRSILEETVRDELTGKKFLLVLDDADIEDECFWSEVYKILNVDALMVTTKSGNVDWSLAFGSNANFFFLFLRITQYNVTFFLRIIQYNADSGGSTVGTGWCASPSFNPYP